MSFDPERQPEDFGDARADPRLRASPTPRRFVKPAEEKTFRSRPPEGLFTSAAAPATLHSPSASSDGNRRNLSLNPPY